MAAPAEGQPSDAARRMADIVNGYLVAIPWEQLCRQFLAVRLADGGSDGVLYDSRRDAVRHQLHEQLCCYVAFRNIAAGISPREAEAFIGWNRAAYDAGFRLPDPDDLSGGPELIAPVAREDLSTQVRTLRRG